MPKGSVIRSLAAAYNSPIVAAAFFESVVQVWDICAASKIAEFPTVFDFGGDRLGISPDGATVVAASYHAPGVAAYSSTTGALLWRRGDLRMLQWLEIDPTGTVVACGFDRRPLEILSLKTGETIEQIRAVREAHSSPFGEVQLLEKKNKMEIHAPNRKPIGVERETFAVLSVAFGPNAIAISESGGALRCINIADGSLRWRYCPPEGAHVMRADYSVALKAFLAIRWNYKSGGKITPMLELDSQTGAIRRETAVETSNDCCFCCEGSRLVSSSGWIIDTATGQLTGSIEVPLTDYRT